MQINTASIDQEIDMATNNPTESNNGSKQVTFDDLASQERRTRIAFLENQQAELETEIRLLRQNVEVPPSNTGSEKGIRQASSGIGDSSVESNPELDALSKMVVDKVLERIKTQYQAENSFKSSTNKPVCDDKTAVTQMRHLLQRERNLVSELQVHFFCIVFFVFC